MGRKNAFRTVQDLLTSSEAVTLGNAVHTEGYLYDDSMANLMTLRDLEPHIRELVDVCVSAGIECDALYQIIKIMGEDQ
jgi:hypothetical protein